MGPEFVTIRAGGAAWSAFERVMVEASFKNAAREFHIDIAAEPGPMPTAGTFAAGTEIEIYFNGDLALRGYVDRYKPSISEHETAKIAVSGRSKSQDLIDSSAVHKTGRFEKKTPAEIGQELDKAGVGVKTDRQLDKVPHYQLTPGETVFRAIEKLCRAQGMTITCPPDGSMLITDASQAKRHAGGLIESRNIKTADADHNFAGRHSKVIVRGQRPFGHGDESLAIEAVATDDAMKRQRPVIVFQDDDTEKGGRAKKRAKRRRDAEAGNSLRANVTVQGFRDDGGKLWTPGYLVFVDSPFLAISQDMLVEKATFSQSRGQGSETVLQLVDPRAYNGKGGKGGKAGKAWSIEPAEQE